MVTGATDSQRPIPEFLTARIHSQPDLQRQESTHDTTMNTTLPVAETVPVEQSQDPINRRSVPYHDKEQPILTEQMKTSSLALRKNTLKTFRNMISTNCQ